MSSSNSAEPRKSPLPERARHELWREGCIAEWYLYEYQLKIIEFLRKITDPFIEAARQIGKTTTIGVHCREKAYKQKMHVTRWCEPWKNQAREIVMPEMDKLNDLAPEGWAPYFVGTDSYYQYPNGSRLALRGINDDKGKSARGNFADIVVADEFGFWTEPGVLRRVLIPQLRTRRIYGAQSIIASTPPEDLGHPYYEEREIAKRQGRFMRMTILDIGLPEDEINRIAEEQGGWHHPDFRREYLCEDVADEKRLVVPEYDPNVHDVSDDYPVPQYVTRWVGGDLGFHDFTGIVFMAYDFLNQELIIEDEVCVAGQNSKQIVELCIEREKRLWGNHIPEGRWCDNDPQILYDMLTLHGYSMTPVEKGQGYMHAALNDLRIRFQINKIKIKRRCKNLRHQLRVGMWNTNKTSFARGETSGHLDVLAGLTYGHKNIDFRLNPWPKYPGSAISSHIIIADDEISASERALAAAFSNPYKGD